MERWDARYRDGRLAGFELVRGEPVPDGIYHYVVEITLRHRDGSLLLMQRDISKQLFPGYYEASASGSVLQGETALQGAKRELAEETGIRSGEWQELGRSLAEAAGAIYINYLCLSDWPKQDIHLQPGETMNYRWVSQAEFLADYEDRLIGYQRDRLRHYHSIILDDIK